MSSSSSPFLLVLFPLFLVVFFGFSFSRAMGAREEDGDGGGKGRLETFSKPVFVGVWAVGGQRSDRSHYRWLTWQSLNLFVLFAVFVLP